MSGNHIKPVADLNLALCRNLQALTSRAVSVADFCRRAGFNRQQFNKYLAGTHSPSRRSLTRIAAYIGLQPEDFLLPPEQFIRRLDRQGARVEDEVGNSHFLLLERYAKASVSQLKPFLGTYHRYHRSSIYSGMILRAVTVIYPHEDVVRYVTVESMQVDETHGSERYGFTYRGVCYFMGNRVIMCDYERRQRNEMTTTILMPQFRSPLKYMFGLLTGIASTAYGQPFATQVAYQRMSDAQSVQRHVLRQAALLAPDDVSIPAAISQYLSDAKVMYAAM